MIGEEKRGEEIRFNGEASRVASEGDEMGSGAMKFCVVFLLLRFCLTFWGGMDGMG
jgi:hypothetical protein